ncbi:MAG: hypothetical protein H0V71_13010 [Chloroflexi bacterium]|nr:hypothetical protein [Chloroflexota bacterium]
MRLLWRERPIIASPAREASATRIATIAGPGPAGPLVSAEVFGSPLGAAVAGRAAVAG